MPAAAVIPAPIAYIKVVAVKKLVVEFQSCVFGGPPCLVRPPARVSSPQGDFYCEKIRVFKAGIGLDTLAWNNKIGPRRYFVGCGPR